MGILESIAFALMMLVPIGVIGTLGVATSLGIATMLDAADMRL